MGVGSVIITGTPSLVLGLFASTIIGAAGIGLIGIVFFLSSLDSKTRAELYKYLLEIIEKVDRGQLSIAVPVVK